MTISIGALSFNHAFTYVRPCNFEVFCSSLGFFPSDLKLLRQPPVDDSCSVAYCLDPKLLPPPVLRSIEPSTLSTLGGTTVTVIVSDLLAVSASDISVSLRSSRSDSPIAATVVFFDAAASLLTFVDSQVSIEGSYQLSLSTKRSRQLVSGVQILYGELQYETPIVGKAIVTSIFPAALLHNRLTTVYISLGNFVPLVGSASVSVMINGNQSVVANVLVSSRLSTLVSVQLRSRGPAFLNLSLWNSQISSTRSADVTLAVEAPPVAVVHSVFPNSVEVGTGDAVNVGLFNVPFSVQNGVQVRVVNGSSFANATVSLLPNRDSVFFTFQLPSSKIQSQNIYQPTLVLVF
jgi:hypothetical protein